MRASYCLTCPLLLVPFLILGLILVVRAGSDSDSSELQKLKGQLKILTEQMQQLLSSQNGEELWFAEPLRGPPGKKGETGSIGLSGKDGNKGERGERGNDGPPGAKEKKEDRAHSGPLGPKRSKFVFPPFCTAEYQNLASSTSQSINYPSYNHNLDLCYIITPPPGKKLVVSVTKIETETGHDYFDVYRTTYDERNRIGRLSGRLGSSLYRIFSVGVDKSLLIHFHSNASVGGSGFSFSFVAQ